MINTDILTPPLVELQEGHTQIFVPSPEPIVLNVGSLQLPKDNQTVRKLIEACSFVGASSPKNASTNDPRGINSSTNPETDNLRGRIFGVDTLKEGQSSALAWPSVKLTEEYRDRYEEFLKEYLALADEDIETFGIEFV